VRGWGIVKRTERENINNTPGKGFANRIKYQRNPVIGGENSTEEKQPFKGGGKPGERRVTPSWGGLLGVHKKKEKSILVGRTVQNLNRSQDANAGGGGPFTGRENTTKTLGSNPQL